MLEIFSNYWQIILGAVLFIIALVVALIRKKPVGDILSSIYTAAVDAVNSAETIKTNGQPVSGDTKLRGAVYMVSRALQANYPNLDVSKYTAIIVAVIENILTTPQKKGGK